MQEYVINTIVNSMKFLFILSFYLTIRMNESYYQQVEYFLTKATKVDIIHKSKTIQRFLWRFPCSFAYCGSTVC